MPGGRVNLRFYAELNDHLAPGDRFQTIEKTFLVPGSVKDLIESCGVPHTEVELIILNGDSVPFSYLFKDGDRIAVYPVPESFDIAPELKVRAAPLREPAFVLDVHLGRLAAYLRMLGFDSLYTNDAADPDLVRISAEQHRILLTRDRQLLCHSALTHGYIVRQTDARAQTEEILKRFDLIRSIRPFTRCMACNGVLANVAKEQVRDRLPALLHERHEEFRRCPDCGRVYWRGTHYWRMQELIAELTRS